MWSASQHLVNTCCEELTSFTWQASKRQDTDRALVPGLTTRAWDTLLRAEERETVTVIAFNYKVNECKHSRAEGPPLEQVALSVPRATSGAVS